MSDRRARDAPRIPARVSSTPKPWLPWLRTSLQRLRGGGASLRAEDPGALDAAREELAAARGESDAAEKLVAIVMRMGFTRASVFWRRAGQLELAARSGGEGIAIGAPLASGDAVVKLLSRLPAEVQRHELSENPRLRPVRDECLRRFDELGADVLIPIRRRGPKLLGLCAIGSGGRRLAIAEVDALTSLAREAVGAASAPARPAEGAMHGVESGGRIGPYRLEWRLGTGGTGDVYLAADTERGRPVVLKFLHAADGDEERLEATRRETPRLVALDHASIIRIFALEETEEHAYLVMEFVDGPTLAEEMLRKGEMAPRRALEIALQLAEALAHASDEGIHHGDLKPGYVMLGPDGLVKLGGFGLWRWSGRGAGRDSDPLGRGSYAAPEARGATPPSAAADMYALGAIVHDLLTGQPPGSSASAARTPAPAAPVIPAPIAAPLSRMLAAVPGERHRSYRELLDDLHRALAAVVRAEGG